MQHDWQTESDTQIHRGGDPKAWKANLKLPGSQEEH